MRIEIPVMLLSLAACVAAALSPGPASAAQPGWMLNGKTLTEEGLTTTAVKTVAVADESPVASAGGLTVTCNGNVQATLPTIQENHDSSASSLTLTACSASPATCKVPSTIGTVPLSLEGTLDGTLATKGIIRPTPGTVFTTIAITGSECAATGNKSVTGDFEMLSPEGQDERTDQLETTKQSASGLLKFGSTAAALNGTVLVLLANNAAWSFL